MAHLIYSVIASLDGYVADRSGSFDWAEPDEEVHAFVNDLERPVGTHLYGRRMYELMRYWDEDQPGQDEVGRGFAAAWRAKPKWVVSRTLNSVGAQPTALPGES